MSNDEERYNEILRRAAARKEAKEKAAAQVTLSSVLNSLNALDTLDDIRVTDRKGWLCWGPRAFKGSDWVGALVWCKPATYHGYRLLTVLGIWAIGEENAVDVVLGTRLLPYHAPFYEAEAYHKLMRDGFDIYYEDKGSPPEESGRLFVTRYETDKRLDIRVALKAAIVQWATQPS
jgi:hypothetical protein